MGQGPQMRLTAIMTGVPPKLGGYILLRADQIRVPSLQRGSESDDVSLPQLAGRKILQTQGTSQASTLCALVPRRCGMG
jgi:hypothetical protein